MAWRRLLALCALAALALPAHADDGPIVRAPAGAMQGLADGDIRVFKGLPYAQPPVGPLRWKPPKPLAAWPGVRQATRFGPACIQPAPQPKSIYSDELPGTSEDCLTLNIWAPKGARRAPASTRWSGRTSSRTRATEAER